MKKTNKIGNQGFSFVELIIVVAIITVIGGVMTLGLSLLTSKPVEECTRKLQIALEGNRTTTMGKLSAELYLYVNSEGDIMMKEVIDGSSKVTQIGESVTVQYQLSGGSLTSLPSESGALKIVFDRSRGSLKPQTDGGSDYVEKFVISRGDKKQEVKIEWLTGRVSVD